MDRGGDTDTIGAIAGARFGASPLPNRWLDAIEQADDLESLAEQFREMV